MSKVPTEDREVIRKAFEQKRIPSKLFHAQWAEKYGCSPATIQRICTGLTYGVTDAPTRNSLWDMPRPVLNWRAPE
jgi:hypothetical protein